MIRATTNRCGNLCVTYSSPIRLPEKLQHLISHYTITDPETLEQCKRNQAMSATWHHPRQNRLTASNFGEVMLRKPPPNEKFCHGYFLPVKIFMPHLYLIGKEMRAKPRLNI